MEINHPQAIAAVVLAVISFYGMTYVVIALTTGWRFGYWLAGASFGVLMVLMSLFWITTALGPRGAEPKWIPIASGSDRISQASFGGRQLASPAQYPTGPWQTPAEDDAATSEFESAVANCLTASPDSLPEDDQEACAAAQEFLPPREDIPVLDGAAVALTPELTDIRFTGDGGATLAQATVVPLTRDPRVADDPEQGEPLGEPFLVLAVREEGSLRLPAYASLVIFALFAAFHLWGLHRAEQRKLSPAV